MSAALLTLLSLLLFSSADASEAEPLFHHSLSLCEFGMLKNEVETLQLQERLSKALSHIRTNDYQNLQLKFRDYATKRAITRMGPYLISQSAERTTGPNGPGVGIALGSNSSVNPAASVASDSATLIFSSEETTTYTLTADTGKSKTAQSCLLTYRNPQEPSQSIVDYNVVGSAYHDIAYHALTPVLYGDEEMRLQAITVFSEIYPDGVTFSKASPSDPFPLPSGHKFRLEILHQPTGKKLCWLLYLQPESEESCFYPEEVFWANFDGKSSCLLKGDTPFTGFIRVAVIQIEPPPHPQRSGHEVESWAQALRAQTVGTTPAALYMLFPKAFTYWAKDKILSNQATTLSPPNLTDFSLFIPLIARADLECPELCQAFQELVEAYQGSPEKLNPCDETTNPFLLYWNLLLAKYLGNEMDLYQEEHKTPPNYWVYATPESVEMCYDTHRTQIPTNAELVIRDNAHGWTYTTRRCLGSEQEGPLIVFPGYKTLHPTYSHLEGLFLHDPVRGPLYTAVALDDQISFQESPLPLFLEQGFFPKNLSEKLSISEKWQLVEYLKQTLKNGALPSTLPALFSSPDAYVNGKVLFQTALTLLYGSYVLEKIQGYSPVEVYTKTRKLTDAIKRMLEKWLYAFQIQERIVKGLKYPLPYTKNYFMGDVTTGGVCYSLRGLTGQGAHYDRENATYRGHDTTYGYWLLAAAAVISWENTYAAPLQIRPWLMTLKPAGSLCGKNAKMKGFIDMLWRDIHNPDPEDPTFPYNRSGNAWEGHSTLNGLSLTPNLEGRTQESLIEDFTSWLAVYFYAKGVLDTQENPLWKYNLADTDVKGFKSLKTFATTHLSMTARAGALFYKSAEWPYTSTGFDYNACAGTVTDCGVHMDPPRNHRE